MANDLTAAPPAALTPADMLKIAVDQGADLDKLEKFMELARRWDEDQARKAFNEAVANFKANAPRLVNATPGQHGKYADLDSITGKLTPALARWGLSHSWGMAQEGERVAVTCRLAHVGGHSEEVTLSAPPDTGPGRNAIQALKSSTTYLCRITLLGVTGMATGVGDDDGQTADGDGLITAEQKERLIAMQQQVAERLDRPVEHVTKGLLKRFGIESLDALPAARFVEAVQALEAK